MGTVTSNGNSNGQASGGSSGVRRRIRLWFGFMILFLGWAGYTYVSQSGEIGNKSLELAAQQASKTSSEQNLNQLKYELNRLKDPEYIGQIAMKKYGLYRPGEIPVRISDLDAGND